MADKNPAPVEGTVTAPPKAPKKSGFKKGQGGRPKGVKNKVTRAAKAFAEDLLNDPLYQKNLKERILSGSGGSVERYLWERIVGAPKQEVEIITQTPLFQIEEVPALTRKKTAEE